LREKSAIWEIIKSIPELDGLNSDKKDNALNFIVKKLNKLSLKIHKSPFEPQKNGSRFNLNNNFQQAVLSWLRQFDEDQRLGILISVLSLTYITKSELETLLDISITKFNRERNLMFERWAEEYFISKELISSNRNIIPYSLSETAISEDIKQTAHFSYIKDNKPTEGHFINLLEKLFHYLRLLADPNVGNSTVYKDDDWFPVVSGILSKLIRSDILIIEDCSYSGTTIKSDIKKLIELIKIAFIPYEEVLKLDSTYVPHFYILLPICTDVALKEIEQLVFQDAQVAKYFSQISTGYVFDEGHRFTPGSLPKNMDYLTKILPDLDLIEKVKKSLKYFHEEYSNIYWTKELLERTNMTDLQMQYGYRGGGWAISTFHNCPNNSLPLYWFPNHPLIGNKVDALLKRNEHRSKHDPTLSDKINSDISICVADEEKELKHYLDQFYEKYKRLLS
jgi:hypothetical protein